MDGAALQPGKSAVLFVDLTPHVGNKLLAFRKLQHERNTSQVPLYMMAVSTDKRESGFVAARVASMLAQEWQNGSLKVSGPNMTKDDAPPPLPEEKVKEIPGAKSLLAGLSAVNWTICVPTSGKNSIAQKHVKEWKEAPAEFREKFDVLANAHKAFESK